MIIIKPIVSRVVLLCTYVDWLSESSANIRKTILVNQNIGEISYQCITSRDFLEGKEGILPPGNDFASPELGLNSQLAFSQQLYSSTS